MTAERGERSTLEKPADSSIGSEKPHLWHRLFLTIGAIGGLALLITLPPLSSPDEAAHYLRASTIANGWLLPPLTKEPTPQYRIGGCAVAANFRLFGRQPDEWADRFAYVPCSRATTARGSFPVIKRTEAYTPIPYIPAAVGFRIGRALYGATGSTYGARLVQLAAYLALMALAIRITPIGKPLFFLLALLPVTLQSAIGISADPVNTALTFLMIGLTLQISHSRRSAQLGQVGEVGVSDSRIVSTPRLLTLGALCVLMAVSKSVYLPMVAVVATIPTEVFGSFRRRLKWALGIMATSIAVVAAWSLLVVTRIETSTSKTMTSAKVSERLSENPFELFAMIGRSWGDASENTAILKGLIVPHYRLVDRPSIALWMVAIVAIVAIAVRLMSAPPRIIATPDQHVAKTTKSDRIINWIVVAGVIIGTFVLIELGLLIVGSSRGFNSIIGFQGRYLLPLIPLSLIGAKLRKSRYSKQLAIGLPIFVTSLIAWWVVVTWMYYNTFA